MDGDQGRSIQRFEHDSALGRWRVDVAGPVPALAHVVHQIWYSEGRVAYARDRILPGGGALLLFNLGPRQYRIEPGPPERRLAFDDIWLAGPHQSPIDAEAPHGAAVLGVVFKPAGLRPWLRIDAECCSDRVLPLTDLLGDRVLALRESLLECQTSGARFALVESWLQRHLHDRVQPSALVTASMAVIEARHGRLGIDALAAGAGVSRRHLAARFRAEVGLTPKAMACLRRFQHLLKRLGQAGPGSWPALANECGYYDQSHLIRDFHAYTGMAPGDFLRCAQPDPGSIVLR